MQQAALQPLTSLVLFGPALPEMVQVGQPPAFAYFLSDGQAATSVKKGPGAMTFQPSAVAARPFGKARFVSEGDRRSQFNSQDLIMRANYGWLPGSAQEPATSG